VFRLIYRSNSRLPLNDDGLQDLHAMIAKARRRNASLNVTGVLYFDGTHFTQLLEGPPDAVEAILRKIRTDQRHDNLAVTSRSMWPHRSFASWSMALVAAEDRLQALGEAGGMPEDPEGFASIMLAVLSDPN
jgi:hypothetical protein